MLFIADGLFRLAAQGKCPSWLEDELPDLYKKKRSLIKIILFKLFNA